MAINQLAKTIRAVTETGQRKIHIINANQSSYSFLLYPEPIIITRTVRKEIELLQYCGAQCARYWI
jgi:hypothetical protein